MDWTPAAQLPPAGKPVLAHVVGLRNDGSGVILRAAYWPERTLACYGEGFGITDPETGEEWCPAGWYEDQEVECPECGEITCAHIRQAVTHWMPLPEKPQVEK